MAEESPPFGIGNSISHGVEIFRRAAFCWADGNQGVFESGDLLVSAGGGASVNIAEGEALIAGTDGSNNYGNRNSEGMYYCYNNATVNLGGLPATTGTPRIDAVVARLQDDDYDSTGQFRWQLHVFQGTPAGSPVPPTITGSAGVLLLAYITWPATQSTVTTGMLSDQRSFVAPLTAAGSIYCAGNHTNLIPGTTTATKIPFDTNEYMIGGFSRSSNGLMVPRDGLYVVNASMFVSDGGSGFFQTRVNAQIQQNSTVVSSADGQSSASSSPSSTFINPAFTTITQTRDIVCQAGQVLTLWGLCTTATLNLIGGSPANSYLQARFVGASS